jgi:DNA-binding transcriptional regulator PaaX
MPSATVNWVSRLSNEYQVLPRTDPQLPEALLPDWIGRRVALRIEVLRAQWTPLARARFAEIDAENSSRTAVPLSFSLTELSDILKSASVFDFLY